MMVAPHARAGDTHTMRFKAFPKTGGEWDQTCLRCLLLAGCALLTVQVWARLALAGYVRQSVEEILRLAALFVAPLLVFCSVAAAVRRLRLLSLTAAVVVIVSSIIALLPILLHEGIRN